VDVVVTSPFKRCLQTSAQIVAQLPALQQGRWLADWRLSEVCADKEQHWAEAVQLSSIVVLQSCLSAQ
jgi:hypothetical protein